MRLRIQFPDINIIMYTVYVIILFPVLAPFYLLQHAVYGVLIDYWTYLSIILMTILAIKNIYRISNTIYLIITMYLMLLITTIFHGGETAAVIKHSIKLILLCCVIDSIIKDKRTAMTFLRAVRDICFVLFIINLITCIIWKDGIPSLTKNPQHPYFFFGNVNSTIRLVLPGMLSSTVINHIMNKRFSIHSIVYLAGFLYIYTKIYPTTTSLMAVSFLIVWILFEHRFINHTTQIYFICTCVVLALELLIVVLSDSTIIGIIADLFHKSTDFTGRASLWQRAMISIRENLILGIGKQSADELRISIGNVNGSHNYFLDTLYQRGVIGLSLTMILLFYPLFKGNRRNVRGDHVIYYLVGYSICLLIMFLSEPFYEYEYYFIPIFYATIVIMNRHSKQRRYFIHVNTGQMDRGSTSCYIL